jgi:hypothetical protein
MSFKGAMAIHILLLPLLAGSFFGLFGHAVFDVSFHQFITPVHAQDEAVPLPMLPRLKITPSSCGLGEDGDAKFMPAASFYVVTCPNEVYSVNLAFGDPPVNTVILDQDFAPVDDYYGHDVDVSSSEGRGIFRRFLICRQSPGGGIGTDDKDKKGGDAAANDDPAQILQTEAIDAFKSIFASSEQPGAGGTSLLSGSNEGMATSCREYTFDVVRKGITTAQLSALSVNAQHEGATLDPPFDPKIMDYRVLMPTGQSYIIMAAGHAIGSTVAIDYPRDMAIFKK